jgi:hypothetical protein
MTRRLRILLMLVFGLIALMASGSYLRAADSITSGENDRTGTRLARIDWFDAPLTLVAITGTGVYLIDRQIALYAIERMRETPMRPPPRIVTSIPIPHAVRAAAPGREPQLPSLSHN